MDDIHKIRKRIEKVQEYIRGCDDHIQHWKRELSIQQGLLRNLINPHGRQTKQDKINYIKGEISAGVSSRKSYYKELRTLREKIKIPNHKRYRKLG